MYKSIVFSEFDTYSNIHLNTPTRLNAIDFDMISEV